MVRLFLNRVSNRARRWPTYSAMNTRKRFAGLSMLLIACSQGADGTAGPAGAEGPQGSEGPAGPAGNAGNAGSGGQDGDAGASARPAGLVWKDANGAVIPVVGVSDMTFNNALSPFVWLHYLESDGTMWNILAATGAVYPVEIATDVALAYDAPSCGGNAYVVVALPARVTFQLENDPSVRTIKDNATVHVNMSHPSYQATFAGACTTNTLNATASVLLSDTVTVAVPSPSFKAPVRPELSK